MTHDPSRVHEHPAAEPLRDGRLRARQALSALKAIEPRTITGEVHVALSRCASALRDVCEELERIEQAMARGQR